MLAKLLSRLGATSAAAQTAAWLALRSPNTQRGYLAVILEFDGWLKESQLTWPELTHDHCLLYTAWALERPGATDRRTKARGNATPRTVLRKLFILRSLYCYLCSTRSTPFDTAIEQMRHAPEEHKRQTEAMTPESVARMFENVEGKNRTQTFRRAFLAVLFGGGLRINEAVNLTVGDVLQIENLIVLCLRRTKAQKSDEQVLPQFAGAAVLEWLEYRAADGADANDPLFVHCKTDKRMCESTARRLFKSLCREAGLAPIYSPHSARATACTQLLELGLDYGLAKTFMRHSSIGMVQVYDKRRAHRQDHPGTKLVYPQPTTLSRLNKK